MESVIEGRWKNRGGVRLHIAPEGLTLVDDAGSLIGSSAYSEVADVSASGRGGRSHLRTSLKSGTSWEITGLHSVQARYGVELIQEQLSALKRQELPLFRDAVPLSQVAATATTLLGTSPRAAVELIDFVCFQAAVQGASDVHFEPFAGEMRVRFRVDGVLVDAARIPNLWHPRLLARLKVIAELAVYRTDVAQEGRFGLRLRDRTVDVRVTLLPTLHGEKAVLRLFDPARSLLHLNQLGMTDGLRAQWESMIQAPQGLLLLTGPSNHGKTTTMYASLQFLHEHRRDLSNLCTVEDPVEHDLRVINQTQVNNSVGLTFAHGLRTVLRQDPEVIMLGEIRDEETAEIAVRAGLTGHLILSTVHAPSAAAVFARLIDLGCPPFLVASSVAGAMAQRLVRRLCHECRRPISSSTEEWAGLGENSGETWEAAGCSACAGTGYRGRMGIFQLLTMDDRMREGVMSGRSTAELEGLGGPGTTLREAGLAAVRAGLTSASEVVRVLGRP